MYIFCLKLVCQRRMAHVSFSIKNFVLHLSIVFLVNPSSLVASSPQDLFLCEFPFCNRFSRRQHGLHAARFSCPAILLFSGLHVGGFLFPLARRSAGSFSRSGVDRVFLTPLVFGPRPRFSGRMPVTKGSVHRSPDPEFFLFQLLVAVCVRGVVPPC
jgi:hypothetical protein